MKTKKLLFLFLIFGAVLFLGVYLNASAQTPSSKCDLANFKEYGGVCFPINTGLAETEITVILKNLLMWLLGIFGFIAIIAFIISGVQYLVSAGDEKTIETAKRNMKWSLVGVIVALSGLIIIQAVTAALKAASTLF